MSAPDATPKRRTASSAGYALVALLWMLALPGYAELPAVVGSSPVHGSRDAYRDDPVVVRFSEPVRAGNTLSSISVRAAGASVRYQAGTRYNELVVLPTSVLPATTSVKESLGKPFPDGYTWSFRTAWTGGGGQAQ